MGFHRVVGYALRIFGEGMPLGDEFLVDRRVDRFEVVPRGEMADERLGIDTGQFLLSHRERDRGDVLGLDSLVPELLVEGNVGVAVDGGHHRSLFAGGAELLDRGNASLPVGVAERRVVDRDVRVGDALRLEIRFENLVGGTRIDIVGALKHPALDLLFLGKIVDRRDRLLVGRGAGIEDIALALFPLVLHGIKQDAVELLEHGQYRLARYRRPAAEHGRDFVLGNEFARLLREQRPVRGRIDHDRFELLAEHAALLVLLLDEHEHDVFQRGLADRHGAGEGMQDADFDRVLGPGGKCRGKAECQSRGGGKQVAGERSLGDRAERCVHRDVLLFDGQRNGCAPFASAESQAPCQPGPGPKRLRKQGDLREFVRSGRETWWRLPPK